MCIYRLHVEVIMHIETLIRVIFYAADSSVEAQQAGVQSEDVPSTQKLNIRQLNFSEEFERSSKLR